ncbi:MAG: DUF4860 domain-containing protein [Eubacteriales bacterium]|nr:DUF4860 domain-containing protein [Eubacteriales bacterium]
MRKKGQREHSVELIFVLLTFLIYTLSMLALVYLGAAVYRRTMAKLDEHNTLRTARAYVTEKLRQNDCSGVLGIASVGGQRALAIREEVAGREYTTYIYCYEGSLREMLVRSDLEASAEAGTELLQLRAFDIWETEDGDFTVSVVSEQGAADRFFVHRDSE